ncbi:MAG: hypothetical protein AB1705_02415 [Verrucomicrobiota bacterium]
MLNISLWVDREIRQMIRPRGPRHFVALSTAKNLGLFGSCLMAAMVYWLAQFPAPDTFAAQVMFFTGICIVAFVMGLAFVSFPERTEPELDLIFLTGLSGLEIVLGKLAGAVVFASYALVAAIPPIVTMIVSGFIGLSFALSLAIKVATLFWFAVALGIFALCVASKPRERFLMLLLVALAFCIGLPVAAYSLNRMTGWEGTARVLAIINPIPYVLWGSTGGPGSTRFWHTTFALHGLGWLLVFTAGEILSRLWRRETERRYQPERSFQNANLARRFPAGERARMLDVNPIWWLASRDGMHGIKSGALLFAGTVGFLWVLQGIKKGEDFIAAIIFFLAGMITLTTGCSAFVAAESLIKERREGRLEMILATRVRESDWIKGVIMAVWHQMKAPAAMALVLLLVGIAFSAHKIGGPWWPWLLIWGATAVTLLSLLYVATWSGIWYATESNEPMFAAIGTANVLTMGAFFLAVGAVQLLGSLFELSLNGKYWIAGITVTAGSTLAVWAAQRAERKLGARIRERAGMREFIRPKPARLKINLTWPPSRWFSKA